MGYFLRLLLITTGLSYGGFFFVYLATVGAFVFLASWGILVGTLGYIGIRFEAKHRHQEYDDRSFTAYPEALAKYVEGVRKNDQD